MQFFKCAVRAITNSDDRVHSAPLFAKLDIMDIFSIKFISNNYFQVHVLLAQSVFAFDVFEFILNKLPCAQLRH